MDLSEEEIERFWAEKLESDKRCKERNKRHQEILHLYRKSTLPDIKPHWHTNVEEIDLSKQRENLGQDLLEEGFTILDSVDIELLFDKMSPGNPEMFREKNLYNEDLCDLKISDVLDKWINKVRLIPPTILVFDKTIYKSIDNTNQLFATDGKHRINVAYYYGATQIPILVINKQLDKIKSILKII